MKKIILFSLFFLFFVAAVFAQEDGAYGSGDYGNSYYGVSAPSNSESSNSAGSGGSSGGGSDYRWECTEWSTCSQNGEQKRTCTNIGASPGNFGKPTETRTCSASAKETDEVPEENDANTQNELSSSISLAGKTEDMITTPMASNNQLTGNVVNEFGDAKVSWSGLWTAAGVVMAGIILAISSVYVWQRRR